jgi:hypothetical protein
MRPMFERPKQASWRSIKNETFAPGIGGVYWRLQSSQGDRGEEEQETGEEVGQGCRGLVEGQVIRGVMEERVGQPGGNQ